ncbi:MAG TPA: ArsB/NhaD family transporter [Firmicutes bacterium]|nr:ArsB/NhaD family transporter [Bacillota bacterium]
MELQQIIAICIFLGVIIAIISEKIHRTVAALVGAVLLLLTHVLTVDGAMEFVDVNTVGVLVGMMLFVAVVKNSGLFEYIAIRAAKFTRGQPIATLIMFTIITTVLSAFLDNVTTVLLIGPMAIAITQILEINPVPFLITQAIASNLGGTATLIGDPPNIMIGSAAGLSFMDFVMNTGVVVLIVLVIYCLLFSVMYRKELVVKEENMQKVMKLDENLAIKDKGLLIKSVVMIVLVVVAFIFHDQLGVESATVALTAAGIMLLIGHQDAEEIVLGVEWSTILFFIGLFVVVGGLNSTGIISAAANWLLALIDNNLVVAMMLILWASAILSAFLDNIPFVAAMIPLIMTMGDSGMNIMPLWWALSLGACLGGNGSLIGASANVVLAGIGAKNGHPITFAKFLKVGFPLMLISIVISTIYLLVRFA